MRTTLSALALLAAATGLPAAAQDTAAPAEDAPSAEAPAEGAAPAPGPDAGGLSMGEPAGGDGMGQPYVQSEHGDWDIRCIRTPDGDDPCQLYQLLEDADGNAVAEFSLFPLVPPQGEAVAGGSVISPLETLLTQQVTMTLPGAEPRRYPFTFCNQVGCFARVGFSAADIAAFKAGSSATVSIVPVLAPDERISLDVSLTGFTAGYDALAAIVAERAAAAAGAAPEGGTAPEAAPEGNN